MYFRVCKYLSNKGVDIDPEADNSVYFKLQDNGSGPYIATWNVPGVAKPTVSQLPTAGTSETWAKTARNAGKITEAAVDSATLEELRVMVKSLLEKQNMLEEK